MKTTLQYNLPNNIVTKSAHSASKLSNKFNIKSKIKHYHQHDVIYYVKYPEEICREDYIGETGRRLSERVIDHSGRDKNSHVLKHYIEKDYKLPSLENFIIKHSREICYAKSVKCLRWSFLQKQLILWPFTVFKKGFILGVFD